MPGNAENTCGFAAATLVGYGRSDARATPRPGPAARRCSMPSGGARPPGLGRPARRRCARPWLRRARCSRPSTRRAAPQPEALRWAVRYLLGVLTARAPGRAVEVRIPPYAAVQCVAGPRHTRGTPPNVVETDAVTWIRLATGRLGWAAAVADGLLRASGPRSRPVRVSAAALRPGCRALPVSLTDRHQ